MDEISQFSQTQTNKTLEIIYGQQYSELDMGQRLNFYQKLDFEHIQEVKAETTRMLGTGAHKLTVNEDGYRDLNFSRYDQLKDLFGAIFDRFLATEKESLLRDESAEISNLKQLYLDYKSWLSQKPHSIVLPPPGFSLVGFLDQSLSIQSFAVLQAVDCFGLVTFVAERRMRTQFAQKFPTAQRTKAIAAEPTLEDQEVEITPYSVTLVTEPVFKSQRELSEEQHKVFSSKFVETRVKVNEFLLSDLLVFARSQKLESSYFVEDLGGVDGLLRYHLDSEFLTENEMRSGWLVVGGDLCTDGLKGIVAGCELEALLEQVCGLADRRLREIIAAHMGNEFVDGW